MKQRSVLATLVILVMSLAISRAVSQTPDQNTQTPSTQVEQPPHVDTEPSSADRDLERTIKDAITQDPHMAYSRVIVHVTDKQVVLDGVVMTGTAKSQAGQIAAQHSSGRKITNRIKVNPNKHPAGGM